MKVLEPVQISAANALLLGDLEIPVNATGLVLFAHGSGSSRLSPRNRFVAKTLNETGLATLLFDLLTREEEAEDLHTASLRFNIELLAQRLRDATAWVKENPETRPLRIGYFGSSTGAAAALVAAAKRPHEIRAIVSRGGRPDLAGPALPLVQAPTLLLVGGQDATVMAMNRDAMRQMTVETELQVVPGATHLFEEQGTLEIVAHSAARWFARFLAG